jgi:hypothetical protein
MDSALDGEEGTPVGRRRPGVQYRIFYILAFFL